MEAEEGGKTNITEADFKMHSDVIIVLLILQGEYLRYFIFWFSIISLVVFNNSCWRCCIWSCFSMLGITHPVLKSSMFLDASQVNQ